MKSTSKVKKVLLFGICVIILLFVGAIIDGVIYNITGVRIMETVFFITFALYFDNFFAIKFYLLASIIVGLWICLKTKRIRYLLLIPFTLLMLLSPAILVFMFTLASNITESLDRFIPVVGKITRIVEGNKEAVFTLVEHEKKKNFHSGKYYYSCYILIENIPDDKMELKRLMIHNFLHLTSAMDSMQTYSDLNYASCMFLKSTSKTRERFSITEEERRNGETYTSPGGRNSYNWYNNKTYIGSIHIKRCENSMKLESTIYTNLGTTDDLRFREREGPEDEDKDILLNECEPDWYIRNKDNVFVKLFNKY